ncbi:MAG TPA: 30S ribosomal protein S8 [Planctomycetota bacterium]|nr:30S ribosomal protein S8 [Planctomycetota bacterium]
MASSDPVGDMIAMIKNANQRRHPKLGVPHSKLKEGVAQVLKSEGYLSDVKVIEDEKKPYRKTMWLFLKYDPENRRVLTDIKRVSTPGRRIFRGSGEVAKVLDGLGVTVLTTSRGILSSRKAKKLNVGGEIICKVW